MSNVIIEARGEGGEDEGVGKVRGAEVDRLLEALLRHAAVEPALFIMPAIGAIMT